MAQHRADVLGDHAQQQGAPLGFGQPGQPVGERAAGARLAAARRAGERTRPRSSAGTSGRERSAATSTGTATGAGSPAASAASSRAVPCSAVTGRRPVAAMRARSTSDSAPTRPSVTSHRPQTTDSAGRPRWARWVARASRNALPAA
ncbi:hypothetical protein APASM_4442 [Actinosynnema pretiosum subsp. pretiosum]|nr:hypothetical protein APASM_4442 [Actinosynnema pretiosum subsp. pretiosum]